MGNTQVPSCEQILAALDNAIQAGDHTAAQRHFLALLAFHETLSEQQRATLRQPGILPSWSEERRLQLEERWQALDAHGGTWAGWSTLVHSHRNHRGEHHEPSHDTSWHGARDLVYKKDPGQAHRCELWRFCANCGPADTRFFESQIEKLVREDEDDEQEGLFFATVWRDCTAKFWRECVHGAQHDQIESNLINRCKGQAISADIQQMWRDASRAPRLTPRMQKMLVRILRVHFACEAQSAEYVQGMHMLVSCPLWAGLNEAEALRVLEFVWRRICVDYYTDPDFAAFQRDACVVEALISERLPLLSKKMHMASIPMQVLMFDPLLCLFTHSTPESISLRFWDVLLIEGDKIAIIALFLALLEKALPESVLEATPEEELSLTSLGKRFSEMTAQKVEEVLLLARSLLDGIGPSSFRQRVQQLRSQPESRNSDKIGMVWEDVRSKFRSLVG